MKREKTGWDVTIDGQKQIGVMAKTYGAACHKALKICQTPKVSRPDGFGEFANVRATVSR